LGIHRVRNRSILASFRVRQAHLRRCHGALAEAEGPFVGESSPLRGLAERGSRYTGGRRSCHSVFISYAWATCRTVVSANGLPMTWSPIGSPASVNPHGTEMAGKPV